MDKSFRNEFKEEMDQKKAERKQEISSYRGRRTSGSIYAKKGLPRRVLGVPYRVAASGCGIAYKAIANKYFAGAACLAIAFGSGVAYGVKNAEDLRDDYTQAVDGAKEFVQDALSHLAEGPVEKEFEEESNFSKEEDLKAYTVSGPEEIKAEKTSIDTVDETVAKENKADGLEGLATEKGEEDY